MNNKTIILLKESDLLMKEVFKYNFKESDIIMVKESFTPFDREDLATKINNNYSQVIFFDYYDQFYLLLPLISKKVIKKYIIDVGIAKLYEPYILTNFQQVMEYKERHLIDFLATTKYDLHIAFSDKISFISLDYKTNIKKKNENSIGILNEYYLQESNFYNELSAIALSKINKAVVLNANKITKNFGLDFSVEIEEERDIQKLIYRNKVNLECRFCDVSNIYFIMSMDAGIPCILGNTSLLDDNHELKKYLVLDSDDDVNEIKNKIELSIKDNKKIMDLYNDWRKKYTSKSKKSVEEFTKISKK